MFNSGIRPAINVGISVSRVGGSAQIKSMKKVAGTLKLDQAQFRELEAFAKFGSDLDPATKLIIGRGRRNQEILKQGQNSPFRVEQQIASIYASTKGLMDSIPIEKVKQFAKDYLELLESDYKDAMNSLAKGKYEESAQEAMKAAAQKNWPNATYKQ